MGFFMQVFNLEILYAAVPRSLSYPATPQAVADDIGNNGLPCSCRLRQRFAKFQRVFVRQFIEFQFLHQFQFIKLHQFQWGRLYFRSDRGGLLPGVAR